MELELELDAGIAHLWLNRPARRNALDEALIAALTHTLAELAPRPDIRVVALGGRGRDFCAGADLDWMRRMGDLDARHNRDDADTLAELLQRLAQMPQPVLARVQGAAIGGGLGLAAACDIVLAARDAHFALSEVRLGLIPATIAPYVVDAIGQRQASRYALSGERFDADEALRLGLVHLVETEASGLDLQLDRLCDTLKRGAPGAQSACKDLLRRVRAGGGAGDAALRADTVRRLALIRSSDEAREGIAAFFEKRLPSWRREGQ
ncbi:enoyl-CoA hydratase-related protein [Paludibacterium yongneupense]|uniref:enoyl-CoA hydratase-related protein n=1 Tax=Paludibacterium yongneupense TaxID=400061 RepID=UPI00040D3E9B|nr:enoyl-CoA hydratase-related protein [Paludibacterium yongneupense]